MYALKNKVQLIGNLGTAPEVKTFESGKKVANFRMATSEVYRNAKGEKVTEGLRAHVTCLGVMEASAFSAA